ncbi:MAG: hypothetical protein DMG04_13305 [Acidobacteria bacterium]|nr:MAG: hypothetical protein DMG04_13305 [Acidobacteriota bacterium]
MILNARHLERVLHQFVDHHNQRRPHRRLKLTRPMATRVGISPTGAVAGMSRCHRTTVSGCTSTTAVRQCRQIRAKAIENS